ncbi:zinc finger MYM-type protein 1-like isoform X1, partial [Tachysurus ichikawai]
MYSKKDSLYCFCCKIFSQKDFKLIKEGLKDWKNASHLLKVHEDSHEHNTNMTTWKELEVCLAKGLTIDKLEMTLDEAERNRWREVLIARLVAIIQSLAERNIALRGSTDTLNKPENGNFLKEVELMAKFDPIMKQHFEESTRESLSALILKRLEELNIPFEDCRGQSYDNGANMKGKNKGVQARLLQLNSRAFFVPCGAH